MLLTKLHGFSKVNVPSKSNVDWDKKVSTPQFKVKSFLQDFWKNDVIVEEFIIPGSKFRIDLFNFSKKIAVEFYFIHTLIFPIKHLYSGFEFLVFLA